MSDSTTLSSTRLGISSSVALIGTDGHLVDVEVHTGNGLPRFAIVGLAAKSVTEAEARVRSALESSRGVNWHNTRIMANLAPAGLRKVGTHFDLAIALGFLVADGQLDFDSVRSWVAIGELAFDGSIRPVRGALAAAMASLGSDRAGLLCPSANAPEAALVDGVDIVPVTSLSQCVSFLRGQLEREPVTPAKPACLRHEDISDVRGHVHAKRAAEIAAAGGHNLLLVGPPGSGKTMLARRIPSMLPAMTQSESLDVTRVHSVAGLLSERAGLITARPFRSPHHHVSYAGLIGGGSGLARPGEVSLAHHGVLFLDEISLYRRDVLDALRQPVEDGVVRIARSGGVVAFPCRFSLVAAKNPCPCGYLGDDRRPCRCSDIDVRRYRARISGPLLDRFDIQIQMARPTKEEMLGPPDGEPSDRIRTRVEAARAIQRERPGWSHYTNASVPRTLLESHLSAVPAARQMIGEAMDSLSLSGRGLDRVLRVARTIADLEGSVEVREEHVGEALLLRAEDSRSDVAA